MYQNFDGIGSGHAVKTILVSNAPFLFCGEHDCATDISEKNVQKIKDKLEEELPSFDEDRLKNVYFLTTGDSLGAMQSYLLGEVSELFKDELGEGHGVNTHAWARLIQDEISCKKKLDSDGINSADDLKKSKCIDRKYVTESMTIVANNTTRVPDMNLVNAELMKAGWTTTDLLRMSKKMSHRGGPSILTSWQR